MIYRLAKILFTQTLQSFFKKIRVSGLNKIPKTDAVIFVSNHPSTLIDPLLIGSIVPRELHFLAAAEFMGKGIIQKILKKYFNMIPVFRASTRPGETEKNQAIFSQCIAHLKQQGTLLIFPEGTSVTSPRLQPLKTGTARIALSTLLELPENTPLYIVPIGLNYSDAQVFRSDVYIQIGAPILVNEIVFEPSADDFSKAQTLTEIISKSLEEQVNVVSNNQLDVLFEQISELVMNYNFSEYGWKPTPDLKYSVDKEILTALNYYYQVNPDLVGRMQTKIQNYLQKTAFLKLNDAQIALAHQKFSTTFYLQLLFGGVFFIFGFITNAPPYYISLAINKKLHITSSFKASIGLSTGLLLYLIWYAGFGYWAHHTFHHAWIGILLIVILYSTGRFALIYLEWLKELLFKGQFKKQIKKNTFMMKRLFNEREALLKEIFRYREALPNDLVTDLK